MRNRSTQQTLKYGFSEKCKKDKKGADKDNLKSVL